MDETSARHVILAEAIETADAEGRLLSAAERDQVDRQARQEAFEREAQGAGVSSEEFIQLRARRVLAAAGIQNPGLLALQAPGIWWRSLQWFLPLAAFVVGAATDAIGNPHRVDLVSLPLLGILAWNFAIYLALLVEALLPERTGQKHWLAQAGRWSDGARALRRRLGNLQAQVAVRFQSRWFDVTQALHVHRCKRVLHLCAAAWAGGVIASLLVRGLVVEYRVGWESTFLEAPQVFAILDVLRLPALLVAPFGSFTVEDVAQLRFSNGGGVAGGAAWVWMYVALLVTVVVLPRLLLATWAAWREHRLERRLPLDLQGGYFQRVVSLLQSTQVQVALLATRDEDRVRLLRVLAPQAEAPCILLSTAFGDAFRIVEIGAIEPPAAAPARSAMGGWLDSWRHRHGWAGSGVPSVGDQALQRIKEACDLVMYAPGDDEREAALLRWLDKPVLDIDMGRGGVLPFESFGQCWVQDATLLEAIGLRLPAAKHAGFARISSAWGERNQEKLRASMTAVAAHLVFAATQVEELRSGALTVKHLLPSQRQAQISARQAAMASIVERLDKSAADMMERLRQLHGLEEASRQAMEHGFERRFVVQQPVDASQAGVAGAATGAAMGASVDLLAGGLTLGAAAALGALLGGGAAFAAAAWKNRATPKGATIVQLSDEMLLALAEAALLRYIAIVHWTRGSSEIDEQWKSEVAQTVAEQAQFLGGYWAEARNEPDSDRLVQRLSHTLQAMGDKVLRKLYPM